MSFTTIPQPTALKNRPTQLVRHPSGHVLRTGPYDEFDPGPWPWRPDNSFRPDTRTGRHRRGEAPDPFTKLREDAWTRFLETSEILAQAHLAKSRPNLLQRFKSAVKRLVSGRASGPRSRTRPLVQRSCQIDPSPLRLYET